MSDDDAIETAFHAVTEAQGGTHIADGGWWWLEGFGDLGKEYAAIRDDVAVWDVSPLNKWDFRGPAALGAAQRVFSNDALGLEVGQARYGAFLDADGLMVDDGTVFNTGGDHCWVMTNGKDHDDYFGEARLGGLLEEHADLPPDELRERLLREVETFVGSEPQHDDMTMILLRVEDLEQMPARSFDVHEALAASA